MDSEGWIGVKQPPLLVITPASFLSKHSSPTSPSYSFQGSHLLSPLSPSVLLLLQPIWDGLSPATVRIHSESLLTEHKVSDQQAAALRPAGGMVPDLNISSRPSGWGTKAG